MPRLNKVYFASLLRPSFFQKNSTPIKIKIKTTTPPTNCSLLMILIDLFEDRKDQSTAIVVMLIKTKTTWIIQRSNFQTLTFLLDNCLKGSPAVSAKAPHPHTQEQYHRFPYK